jgi:dipeptidyl aminopeptidase/acylaminoacyl peptidase
VRWTVAGDALLTFRIGAGREDELVRIAVDGEGRMRGAPQVVMSRVPTLFEGRFDVARRTGRLVLATGTATSDVWSLELAGGSARARQLTRGTTWYGTPALSPDGGTAYYLRGDALGDNVYEFHLADGTEEPLTADRQGGIDAVRLSADGHRLAYGHGGPRGLRLELLELPSRRASGRDLPGGGFASWPVGERGILNYSFPDSSMSVFDSLQAPPRPIPMPDSLGVVTAAPAPDGRHAAFLAWSRGGMVLGVASLAAPEVRTLHRLERAPAQGLTWDNDGGIYLGRWLPADATPSIWRTTEAGGELLRVASLPVPCAPVTILVAARGRAAVCQVYDNRSDIWTIEGIGGSRRTDAR